MYSCDGCSLANLVSQVAQGGVGCCDVGNVCDDIARQHRMWHCAVQLDVPKLPSTCLMALGVVSWCWVAATARALVAATATALVAATALAFDIWRWVDSW